MHAANNAENGFIPGYLLNNPNDFNSCGVQLKKVGPGMYLW
jgi:hypothetical protein